MNMIKVVISDIASMEHLNVVSFLCGKDELRMMSLDLDEKMKVGREVYVGTKASNISLAKDLSGLISLSNQLLCKVEAIDHGSLLCSVTLKYHDVLLESVITEASVEKMGLVVGEVVTALIKASELSIVEGYDA